MDEAEDSVSVSRFKLHTGGGPIPMVMIEGLTIAGIRVIHNASGDITLQQCGNEIVVDPKMRSALVEALINTG